MSNGHDPRDCLTAARVVDRSLAPHGEQCLLGDFFGLGGISEDSQRDAVNPSRYPLVQVGEGITVSSADFDEDGFERGVVWNIRLLRSRDWREATDRLCD